MLFSWSYLLHQLCAIHKINQCHEYTHSSFLLTNIFSKKAHTPVSYWPKLTATMHTLQFVIDQDIQKKTHTPVCYWPKLSAKKLMCSWVQSPRHYELEAGLYVGVCRGTKAVYSGCGQRNMLTRPEHSKNKYFTIFYLANPMFSYFFFVFAWIIQLSKCLHCKWWSGKQCAQLWGKT